MKKAYTYIIVPIIVSILASLLYSRVIDPNLDKTILYIGNFFASISSSYLNYIYENIGDGIKEIFSYHTYAAFYAVFMLALLFISVLSFIFSFTKGTKDEIREKVSRIRAKLKNENETEKSRRTTFFVNGIASLIMLIFVLSTIVKHNYTYNAIIYIEKTLDILAPHISEQQRLELRAQYRMINTYDKFNKFNEEVVGIAKEKKIVIPEFKLIVK